MDRQRFAKIPAKKELLLSLPAVTVRIDHQVDVNDVREVTN